MPNYSFHLSLCSFLLVRFPLGLQLLLLLLLLFATTTRAPPPPPPLLLLLLLLLLLYYYYYYYLSPTSFLFSSAALPYQLCILQLEEALATRRIKNDLKYFTYHTYPLQLLHLSQSPSLRTAYNKPVEAPLV